MPGRYFDLVELLEAHLSHLSEQPGSDQFHAILMNPAEVPLIELIRFKTFTRSNPWNEPPHHGQLEMVHFSFADESTLLQAMYSCHTCATTGELLLFGPDVRGICVRGLANRANMLYDSSPPPLEWRLIGREIVFPSSSETRDHIEESKRDNFDIAHESCP
jgi:hypothetical protein